jgi:hypothetical protein
MRMENDDCWRVPVQVKQRALSKFQKAQVPPGLLPIRTLLPKTAFGERILLRALADSFHLT